MPWTAFWQRPRTELQLAIPATGLIQKHAGLFEHGIAPLGRYRVEGLHVFLADLLRNRGISLSVAAEPAQRDIGTLHFLSRTGADPENPSIPCVPQPTSITFGASGRPSTATSRSSDSPPGPVCNGCG